MREKLIKLLSIVQDFGTKSTYEERSITVESKNNETVADFLVANGVTIPVRCKDCKHWHEETGWCNEHSHFWDDDIGFCHPWESIDWKMFDADYFCKDGERRTDNE